MQRNYRGLEVHRPGSSSIHEGVRKVNSHCLTIEIKTYNTMAEGSKQEQSRPWHKYLISSVFSHHHLVDNARLADYQLNGNGDISLISIRKNSQTQ